MGCSVRKSNKCADGIGVNNGKYTARNGSKNRKEYTLWQDMLKRCTIKFQTESPSYVGTTCSENFKSYEYFYEWCQRQTGFGNIDENNRGWHLDKDLLVKGNKIYSEDTCCFIPQTINSLLIRSGSRAGRFLLGVYWDKHHRKFISQCNDSKGKRVKLGLYNEEKDAFIAYKTYKEALIKEVASEYKDRVDENVYKALINYKLEETDWQVVVSCLQ